MWQCHTDDYRMFFGIWQRCDILHPCTELTVSQVEMCQAWRAGILQELGAHSLSVA